MKKIQVPCSNKLKATLQRNTFNEEERTIEVVFATGAEVERFSFFEGLYIEKLSMKKAHVRLDRLKKGAPVLKNHANSSLEDIMGVVTDARVDGEMGVATLKLSGRADLAGLIDDIRDDIIKNISVGYRVHKYKEEKRVSEEEPMRLLAVDWEPLEISFVTIPADASAQARSINKQDYLEVVIEEEKCMGQRSEEVSAGTSAPEAEVTAETTTVKTADGEPKPEEKKPEEVKPEGEEPSKGEEGEEGEEKPEEERSIDLVQAKRAEQKRIFTIHELAEKHELGKDFARSCVEGDLSIERVRELVLEKVEARSKEGKTFNHNLEVNDVDQRQLRNQARERAILHRHDPKKHQLKDGDREFAGNSLVDMAREYLQTELNVRNTLSLTKREVATRALHHSSDFPELLANIANKTLREAYEGAPNTFMPFTREVSRSDFKEGSSIQIGDGGSLEKVNEHGEYKRSGISESAEKYKLEKFGKVIGHTWELMINDDLDAFTRIPARLGVRAREKENEIMWGLIIDNVTMAETGADLFSATHGNLDSTGAAISIDSLGTGRTAMRLQRDLDGELMGGLFPRYLYVPAALETKAQQFVTQISPDASGNVNPFTGQLQVVAEPRLDDASSQSWYLMADSSMIDMAELARLDGRGPEIMTREGFDVDGMEVKVRYVFQCKVIDYRGFYKNVGA